MLTRRRCATVCHTGGCSRQSSRQAWPSGASSCKLRAETQFALAVAADASAARGPIRAHVAAECGGCPGHGPRCCALGGLCRALWFARNACGQLAGRVDVGLRGPPVACTAVSQDASTRPSGFHEPEVTKANTAIKQEPCILSDLKHVLQCGLSNLAATIRALSAPGQVRSGMLLGQNLRP